MVIGEHNLTDEQVNVLVWVALGDNLQRKSRWNNAKFLRCANLGLLRVFHRGKVYIYWALTESGMYQVLAIPDDYDFPPDFFVSDFAIGFEGKYLRSPADVKRAQNVVRGLLGL